MPEQPPFILEYARIWQATDKIVYSTTLTEVASARTRTYSYLASIYMDSVHEHSDGVA